MSANELYAKAIEELDGKTLVGVGNSSRGKTAQAYFINYLKGLDAEGKVSEKIRKEFPGYKEDFNGKVDWTQPKSNGIFAQIDADIAGSNHQLSMTLIQDANQIDAKEVQTGNLLNYVPKEWEGDADNKQPFALQSLNKVFEFNNLDKTKTFTNCWDFVGEGVHALYMDIDSEIVGKNFLYMLTEDKYAAWLKEAYEALDADKQAYFQPTINAMESEAADLGLGADGKYALAWIKLWVESYNAQTDDGPICNTLVTDSATDQAGLLVYSKLRSVEESAGVSVNNINVAAYQDGYKGIGGYGYCHYLFVTENSPLPWTACAFIAYMTCTEDGFSAWGKDMGGYSANPQVATAIETTYNHSKGGYDESGNLVFDAKNDRGYDWWTTDGELVLEDPEYCASVSFTVGSWIELLTKYSEGEAAE